MKKLVKELAESIRETIRREPPEIVELQSKAILVSMAPIFRKSGVFTPEQYLEFMSEVDALYGV